MAASSKKPAGSKDAKGSKSRRAKAAAKPGAQAASSAASTPRHKPGGDCLSLPRQRKLAKDAMWVSLAVLTATAFTGAHKRGVSRSLHIASGAALIGLALWHHSLYNRKKAEQCPEPL